MATAPDFASRSTAHSSSPADPSAANGRWPELDLLRTLAVVLMVTNHSAVRVAAGSRSLPIEVADIIGSMAPVVFFFLTGLGNGVQSIKGRSGLRPDFLIKLGVLLVADALLWMSPTRWIGMDFLGFIALSAIVSKLLTRLPRSGAAALALAGGVVAWRFFVHPKIHGRGTWIAPWLDWLSIGPPGFSYPLTPWLAYPLLGYCLGRAAAGHRAFYESRRWTIAGVLVLAATLATAVCALLQHRGAPFFRWGSVSFSFFVASLEALGFAAAAAILASQTRWAAGLSTQAQASFAAVPLHYATLGVMDGTMGRAWGLGAYLIRLGTALAVSLGGGRAVVALTRSLVVSEMKGATTWGTVFGVTAAALACLAFVEPPWWISIALRFGSQLGLCLLLGLPLPSRTRMVAEAAKSPQPA